MSKQPSPNADRLRVMREAEHEAEMQRQADEQKKAKSARKSAKPRKADG